MTLLVSMVRSMVLVMMITVVASANQSTTADADATSFLALVQAQTQIIKEAHPKAGVDTHRDAHDFNTDAVRIAEAQFLTGREWVRWVLKWNREQYQRSQRDIRIETRVGTRITRQGNTTLIMPYVSTSSYGNGPAVLFNPFVQPEKPFNGK